MSGLGVIYQSICIPPNRADVDGAVCFREESRFSSSSVAMRAICRLRGFDVFGSDGSIAVFA